MFIFSWHILGAMNSHLEIFLNLPLPHLHDMVFDFLDIPAKRACLRASVTLRNFVLDRKGTFEGQERVHDWMKSSKQVSLQLRWPGHEFTKQEVEGRLLVNNENSDIFLITWNKVEIFRNFRHYKTLNFSLIQSQELELEMPWIKDNELYIFKAHSCAMV